MGLAEIRLDQVLAFVEYGKHRAATASTTGGHVDHHHHAYFGPRLGSQPACLVRPHAQHHGLADATHLMVEVSRFKLRNALWAL